MKVALFAKVNQTWRFEGLHTAVDHPEGWRYEFAGSIRSVDEYVERVEAENGGDTVRVFWLPDNIHEIDASAVANGLG